MEEIEAIFSEYMRDVSPCNVLIRPTPMQASAETFDSILYMNIQSRE